MATKHHAERPKKSVAPTTSSGWNTLLSLEIRLADGKADPRLGGLKRAMVEGKAEQVLRMYGVISQADLLREFPD